MHAEPLTRSRHLLLKHTTHQATAFVSAIDYKVDVNSLERLPTEDLQLNEIGSVRLETHRPLYFDPYTRNRATGGFILIDPISNSTVGAGMIVRDAAAKAPGRSNIVSVGGELIEVDAATISDIRAMLHERGFLEKPENFDSGDGI
jgi:sulfate adenylyltransferase subunit 1 (EFTu-like GTPase family)